MHPLSVVIITFNEERNIARCINSVKRVAEEIIVLDSFSNDRTVEIASELGAVVKQEKFRGYIEQKNRALELATHAFALSLDADEAVDKELSEAIAIEKTNFPFKAYSMNRCTSYCGQFIRHGLWYPDRKVRLINRNVASWGGTNPHDRIELAQNVKVKHLRGDILHYSYESIEEHALQNNHFSKIAAAAMHQDGKKSNWLKILVNPLWTFVHGYFIRVGFLDGFYGFVIAMNSAHQTFLKYAKLYRLQKK
jgi:glycosyltransferase involved in cell wall biosynthesis